MFTRGHRPSIAIIGGGFSGLLVLDNLIRLAYQAFDIFWIEKTENWARGVAYCTQESCHLLNVSAAQMGAYAHQSYDFYKWVIEHEKEWRLDPTLESVHLSQQAYLPRKLYGLYLNDIFAKARQQAKKKGIIVHCLQGEACNLEELGNRQMSLALTNGQKITCDILVLAIGAPTAKQPNFLKNLPVDHPFYLADIWSKHAFDQLLSVENRRLLNSQASILILGTGLTMVDACLSLFTRHFPGRVFALSSSGLLPEVHQEALSLYPIPHFWKRGSLTLLSLLKEIRKEIKAAAQIGYNWRAVIDALRPAIPHVWHHLSLKERSKFLRHLFSTWNKHRHRMAPSCGELVENQQKQGNLIVLSGNIQSIVYQTDQTFLVNYKTGNESHILTVQALLNCLGPELNISQNTNEILRNLQAKGYIKFDGLNKGLEVNASYQLKGLLEDRLYGIGNLLFGERLETTAVPELRSQADEIARHILKII
ncbi:FAD/NAD(P)-binding protein [Candidatus Protochlamydia phocaeensis]|uniref:FAD/NAD(P)-binding protein n=1 Tax=Candidatus Protochlamydia phocaeensis TaxID=1414722 RepID=UPI000837DB61|nr:FAD/NAD(P)-binding protein [Candidatus Protochlamydia phocaeensis]